MGVGPSALSAPEAVVTAFVAGAEEGCAQSSGHTHTRRRVNTELCFARPGAGCWGQIANVADTGLWEKEREVCDSWSDVGMVNVLGESD